MPSQKFIFGLALLAIILFGMNVKPELFGSIIKNFPSGLAGPSLACNSPDLIKEFQNKFDEKISYAKTHIGEKPILFGDPCIEQRYDLRDKKRCEDNIRQKYRDSLDRATLHVERTETLGQVGNSLSCSMDYTMEEGGNPETFKFLLGRDDDGHLVWHYDPRVTPPYERPW